MSASLGSVWSPLAPIDSRPDYAGPGRAPRRARPTRRPARNTAGSRSRSCTSAVSTSWSPAHPAEAGRSTRCARAIVQEEIDPRGVCFLATDIAPDGGKIILTAGAPLATGQDEEQMLLALRAIIEREPPLPLHIGVNAGAVFAGDIGAKYRRYYTVMGDAVNLAARVMARAADGRDPRHRRGARRVPHAVRHGGARAVPGQGQAAAGDRTLGGRRHAVCGPRSRASSCRSSVATTTWTGSRRSSTGLPAGARRRDRDRRRSRGPGKSRFLSEIERRAAGCPGAARPVPPLPGDHAVLPDRAAARRDHRRRSRLGRGATRLEQLVSVVRS